MNQAFVGVVGAGTWGRNIVRTLHELGGMAAVAETDPEVRAQLAQDYPGVAIYEGHEALLAGEDVDAVAIATPVHTHHDLTRAALMAGKDVFIEKPISVNSAEAESLVQLAQDQGRILMVGHLLLYQPAIQRLMEEVRGGRIGRLLAMHQIRAKLGRARTFENVMWSFSVHDLAVMLEVAGGAPSRVRALGQAVLQPGIHDDVHLHMEFPGGIQAHLHASWLWPEVERRLTLIGSQGMLVYDEVTQELVLHRKTIDDDLAHFDEGAELLYKGNYQPLELELQHFIDCCKTRSRPRTDGESGVAVVRVMEEAQRQLDGDA